MWIFSFPLFLRRAEIKTRVFYFNGSQEYRAFITTLFSPAVKPLLVSNTHLHCRLVFPYASSVFSCYLHILYASIESKRYSREVKKQRGAYFWDFQMQTFQFYSALQMKPYSTPGVSINTTTTSMKGPAQVLLFEIATLVPPKGWVWLGSQIGRPLAFSCKPQIYARPSSRQLPLLCHISFSWWCLLGSRSSPRRGRGHGIT